MKLVYFWCKNSGAIYTILAPSLHSLMPKNAVKYCSDFKYLTQLTLRYLTNNTIENIYKLIFSIIKCWFLRNILALGHIDQWETSSPLIGWNVPPNLPIPNQPSWKLPSRQFKLRALVLPFHSLFFCQRASVKFFSDSKS